MRYSYFSTFGDESPRTLVRVCGVVALVLAAASVYAGNAKAPVEIGLLENTPDQIVVQYRFGDPSITPIMINGSKYAKLGLGKESLMKTVGAPALPNVARSIIIPADARMAVRVLASD